MNIINLFILAFFMVGFAIFPNQCSQALQHQANNDNSGHNADFEETTLSEVYQYIDWSGLIDFLKTRKPGKPIRRNISHITGDFLQGDYSIEEVFPSIDLPSKRIEWEVDTEFAHGKGYRTNLWESHAMTYEDIFRVVYLWNPKMLFLSTPDGCYFVSPWPFCPRLPFVCAGDNVWMLNDLNELLRISLSDKSVELFDLSEYGDIYKYYVSDNNNYLIYRDFDTFYYVDINSNKPIMLTSIYIQGLKPRVYSREGMFTHDGKSIILLGNEVVKKEFIPQEKAGGLRFNLFEDDDTTRLIVHNLETCHVMRYENKDYEIELSINAKGFLFGCFVWEKGIISCNESKGGIDYYDGETNEIIKHIDLGFSENAIVLSAFDQKGNGIIGYFMSDGKKILIVDYDTSTVSSYDVKSIPHAIHESEDGIYITLSDGGLVRIY